MQRDDGGERYIVVIRLEGAGTSTVPITAGVPSLVLSTEDERYASDPVPIEIRAGEQQISITFGRPGAVVLKY